MNASEKKPVILAVKVHCGSAHVSGKARRYPYFVASLFEACQLASGEVKYLNTGTYQGPFRSKAKAIREGREMAAARGAEFVDGYGSLHHQDVIEK